MKWSLQQLIKLTQRPFSFEESYDKLDITFKIVNKGQLFHIDERSYCESERYELLIENLNKINLFYSNLVLNENVLIMPTNPEYKLFPRNRGFHKKIKKFCPSLIKNLNAYGVKISKQELSEKLITEFAIIPFLVEFINRLLNTCVVLFVVE